MCSSDLRQNGKNPLPHGGFQVEVLPSAEELRDVVTGFGVEDDVGHVHLAELPLGVDNLAHGNFA